MDSKLAPGSSLESLKREAKLWQKAILRGDTHACERFARVHGAGESSPGLRQVQHALAREYGFGNWARLKEHLSGFAIDRRSHDQRVADFLRLACLSFDDDRPAHRARALQILNRHPEVGRDSIWTASACGDRAHVERLLIEDPARVAQKGGPQGWEPLLYLCYSRLEIDALAENSLAIAALLLDRGADPNTHFVFQGSDGSSSYHFSALTGVIGGGDGVGPLARPPHPRAEPIARLLLERGANPNDGQAMYDTMLHGDDDHWLRLLIEYGLGARDGVNWAPAAGSLFQYLLAYAVKNGQVNRARCLLEHGANPNGNADGRSFCEAAVRSGSLEIAELLSQHGATPVAVGGADAFRAACLRAERSSAERLASEHPEYLLDEVLLLQAAGRDLPDAVTLLLDLGMSPNAEDPGGGHRALHLTACNGAVRAAQVLLERGAEPDARDRVHHSTALGWAIHTSRTEMFDLLAEHTRDPWTLVIAGRVDRLRAVIEADPGVLDGVQGRGGILLHHLPESAQQARAIMEILLEHGAEIDTRDEKSRTPAESALDRGSLDVSELLDSRATRQGIVDRGRAR
jgi:ankyrin repeat protein